MACQAGAACCICCQFIPHPNLKTSYISRSPENSSHIFSATIARIPPHDGCFRCLIAANSCGIGVSPRSGRGHKLRFFCALNGHGRCMRKFETEAEALASRAKSPQLPTDKDQASPISNAINPGNGSERGSSNTCNSNRPASSRKIASPAPLLMEKVIGAREKSRCKKRLCFIGVADTTSDVMAAVDCWRIRPGVPGARCRCPRSRRGACTGRRGATAVPCRSWLRGAACRPPQTAAL